MKKKEETKCGERNRGKYKLYLEEEVRRLKVEKGRWKMIIYTFRKRRDDKM